MKGKVLHQHKTAESPNYHLERNQWELESKAPTKRLVYGLESRLTLYNIKCVQVVQGYPLGAPSAYYSIAWEAKTAVPEPI